MGCSVCSHGGGGARCYDTIVYQCDLRFLLYLPLPLAINPFYALGLNFFFYNSVFPLSSSVKYKHEGCFGMEEKNTKNNSIKLAGVFLMQNTVYIFVARVSVVSSVVICSLSQMLP